MASDGYAFQDGMAADDSTNPTDYSGRYEFVLYLINLASQ